MKSFIQIRLNILIVFSSFILSQPLILAKSDKLPRIGSIQGVIPQSAPSCAFTFAKVDDANRRVIFYSNSDSILMNLDGQDTILREISKLNRNGITTKIYGVKNIKIQVDTKPFKNDGSLKATITISNTHQSKVIKAIGRCD